MQLSREICVRAGVAIAFAVCLGFSNSSAVAAEFDTDRQDVIQALTRARAALKPALTTDNRSYIGLYAYACLKLGVSTEDPALASAIDKVAGYCRSGEYEACKTSHHAVYVSGIEAMLLADAGGQTYKGELEAIRNFLVGRQNDHGSWSYTKGPESDTSVTQYAILGLWAAERAGAKVDPLVWMKAVKFLLGAQKEGGFSYRSLSGSPTDSTMTAAGVGCLVICRKYLSGGALPKSARKKVAREIDTDVRYGILRPIIPVEPEPEPVPQELIDPEGLLTVDRIDNAIDNANRWIDAKFTVTGDKTSHLAYWFYTLERAGALAGRDNYRGVDWYDRCADALVPQQTDDGFWNLNSYDKNTDTAFIALFLARPTRKLAGRRPAAPIGGGLLSGGRGLPADLTQFGKPTRDDKPLSPLEQLLADLSEAQEQELPKLQEELVETIQLSRPEELIGQHETLIKLVTHEKADVRRTALWAMGRTGDLHLSRYAIAALDDRDVTVLTEARNSLAWIARRPTSFGHPENPLEGVATGATMEEKKTAVEKWRTAMIRDWGRWYLETSPYADRFDEFDLNLRAKLSKLR